MTLSVMPASVIAAELPRAEVLRPPATGRMRRGSRLTLALASLCLAALYVLPLWHVGLKAPQYPEGLGMYIWASRITGEKPQDLNSINGLNHYIGMQRIVPESIPELRLIPIAIGGLLVLGLLAALWGRRGGLYLWTALFLTGALAGLADFWKWGYQYGHVLDPHAAIKIPGMSYQPPLVGGKQLLNFHATSWPAWGGWVAVLLLAVALILTVKEWRGARLLRH